MVTNFHVQPKFIHSQFIATLPALLLYFFSDVSSSMSVIRKQTQQSHFAKSNQCSVVPAWKTILLLPDPSSSVCSSSLDDQKSPGVNTRSELTYDKGRKTALLLLDVPGLMHPTRFLNN